ncbi:uncharacterized protein LOC109792378 [Cajanus cajan]|uniref:uncharacterized protein LOC109792378 n=1 Tax=Cajanus cajan TaxID=3821 RepID=UPI00098D87DB|nr:uncharacterized protein LOC109792378 [Cajanus cajan]
MSADFTKFSLNHVPREQNSRDLLSKLASTKRLGATRSVIQEVLSQPSINGPSVEVLVIEEDEESWMTPYILYLTQGSLFEGPFPMVVRQLKFLIMAVDYFSKWIEAEPIATISAEKVRTFLWKNVICRYRVLQVLVSDNGTQFTSERVQNFCKEIGIQMMFTFVEHP